MSRADVKQFSGGSPVFDMVQPEEEQVGRGSACNYPQIYIQIDPFPFSVLDAERKKPEQKFGAVSGVGDAAYAHENARSDDAEIFFRVGQRVGTIQMDIPTGQTYESVKPRLIGLAKALAAKLR